MKRQKEFNKIQKKIKNSLLEFEDIFDDPKTLHYGCGIVPSSDGGTKYQSFYFPHKVNQDYADGYKLKNDKGFISIHEKYKHKNKQNLEIGPISFNYKYTTTKLRYECTDETINKKTKLNYNFRYDKDLECNSDDKKESHPQNHLQVLHDKPRFETEIITINKFLSIIKEQIINNP